MTVQSERFSVLAGDGAGYQDVLPHLEKSLKCADKSSPDVESLRRTYWQDIMAVDSANVGLPLLGHIVYLCGTRRMRADVQLQFTARVKDGNSKKFLAEPGKYNLEVALQTPRVRLFDLHEE